MSELKLPAIDTLHGFRIVRETPKPAFRHGTLQTPIVDFDPQTRTILVAPAPILHELLAVLVMRFTFDLTGHSPGCVDVIPEELHEQTSTAALLAPRMIQLLFDLGLLPKSVTAQDMALFLAVQEETEINTSVTVRGGDDPESKPN